MNARLGLVHAGAAWIGLALVLSWLAAGGAMAQTCGVEPFADRGEFESQGHCGVTESFENLPVGPVAEAHPQVLLSSEAFECSDCGDLNSLPCTGSNSITPYPGQQLGGYDPGGLGLDPTVLITPSVRPPEWTHAAFPGVIVIDFVDVVYSAGFCMRQRLSTGPLVIDVYDSAERIVHTEVVPGAEFEGAAHVYRGYASASGACISKIRVSTDPTDPLLKGVYTLDDLCWGPELPIPTEEVSWGTVKSAF